MIPDFGIAQKQGHLADGRTLTVSWSVD